MLQLRCRQAILAAVRGARFNILILIGICLTCLIAGFDIAAPPPVQGPRYSPPALPSVAGNQLEILGVEIQQNNLADAVRRLDSLLHDTPDALLTSTDGGGTISLATWIDAVGADQRKLLSKEYDAQFGEVASRAVRKLNEKGSAEPAEFLSVARRYPFTSAATDAVVAAAHRCGDLGDAQSMRDLLDAARWRGWKGDGSAPSDPPRPATTQRTFCDAMPFAAPWFRQSNQLALDHIFPVAAANTVYVSTAQRALALRDGSSGGATLLWSANGEGESDGDDSNNAQQRPRQRGINGSGSSGFSGRGPSYAPQLVCDDAGSPRLLIVRQPGSSSGEFALRAFRASDGRLLWSSENAPDLRGLTIASNPAVVGRYVYALAADTGQQSDRLIVIAMELTTGRTLWRTDIGSVARRQIVTRYNRPRDPVLDAADPWQNLSAPCASGDSVYVAPNIGCAIALDRFDGHLRWIRPYDPSLEAEGAAAKARRAAAAARQWPPREMDPERRRVTNREGLLRWTVTPQRIGDALLIAPLDNDRVVAIDARSGNKLWHTDDLAAATLIGSSDNSLAIFQERSLAALDKEGDVKWTWDGQSTGPAVVEGEFVFIPTTESTVTLTAADGKVVTNPPVHPPDLKNLLKNDTAKAALASAGALDRLTAKDRDGGSGGDTNQDESPRSSSRSRSGKPAP
jgi:outer membrane protein assembly factor BamB